MSGMYPDNQDIEIFGEQVSWPGVDPGGKFTNGSFDDPIIKPSFIPAETINLILDNLESIITKCEKTPNATSKTQIADALLKKIMNITPNGYGLYFPGRDLKTVLGVSTFQGAWDAVDERFSTNGELDYSGLKIGDYLDGLDLSQIPAERGATAGQPWNDTYKNNRIVLSAFNPYKGVGDSEVKKDHIRFDFANLSLRGRMNANNDNTGGYPASEMRAFLEGANGDGTGSKSGVTTAACLNALKNQIGDCILPVRRSLSTKGSNSWITCSLWLPTEHEIFGTSVLGESNYDDMQKLHIPLYRDSWLYRLKRLNGSRGMYFLSSPHAGSAAYFCCVNSTGVVSGLNASSIANIAPAFCVSKRGTTI